MSNSNDSDELSTQHHFSTPPLTDLEKQDSRMEKEREKHRGIAEQYFAMQTLFDHARSKSSLSMSLLREFHTVFKVPLGGPVPKQISMERRFLAHSMMREEVIEFLEASAIDDFVEMCDALGDVFYIVLGRFEEMGVNPWPIFAEIHRSNMSKLENGQPLFRADGKILKGSNYTPPDIRGVLIAQGWVPDETKAKD